MEGAHEAQDLEALEASRRELAAIYGGMASGPRALGQGAPASLMQAVAGLEPDTPNHGGDKKGVRTSHVP